MSKLYPTMYLRIYLILAITIIFYGCETTTTQIKNENIKKTIDFVGNKKTDSISEETYDEENKTDINNDNELNQIINIGLMLPLTGPHYSIGQSLLNASQLALYTSKNSNINFIVKDVGETKNLTKSFYELVNDDVELIVGPVFSEKLKVLNPMSRDENVKLISFSNNIDITSKNLSAFGLSPEDEIEKLFRYCDSKNLKRIKVILPENIYGNKIKDKILNLKKLDLNIDSKFFYYDPKNPDFYEVSKRVANYETRKENLKNEISRLSEFTDEISKAKIKKLKKLDTYGELNFDALLIIVNKFDELISFSSVLPYYDVDPKKIQYLGTSTWNKTAIVKEPSLNGGIFTDIDQDSLEKFINHYEKYFKEKPHELAAFAFDIIGLIAKLQSKDGSLTKLKTIETVSYSGVTGKFRLLNSGRTSRTPEIYKIKNETIVKLN